MDKDICELLRNCNSLYVSQTTKQKINKKTKCELVSVDQLFKQLNIYINGHLLEQQFNASGRLLM